MSEMLYKVPENWPARAHVDDAKSRELYTQSVRDPEGFWGEHGKRSDWIKPYTRVKRTSFAPGNVSSEWFGDGTINAVASVVLDSGAVFGVLPMGTLNHFARDLRIPIQLDAAIATLAAGHVAQVDVGEVNGRIFLNNSSLGLYPDIVRDRQRQQRRLGRGKWTAFGWATLAALRRYPFLSVRLTLGEQGHARRTPFVFIGNNEYHMQGFNIGERARLDGGALSVYVAQRPTRWGLLKLALRALLGRLRQSREFHVFQAGEMVIETRHRRLRVATDGEVTVMAPPLRYRIRPAALPVIVPHPQEE